MENEVPEFFQERDTFGLEKPKIEVDNEEQLENAQPVELNVNYASLSSRIIAYILDVLILLIPIYILEFMIFEDGFTPSGYSVGRNLFNVLLWTLYYGVTESSDSQATLGKRICGLKVIDENGNKLTFKKASLRYLATVISILPLGFGIWVIDDDKKKQGWHDMLMGCYVIKTSERVPEEI